MRISIIILCALLFGCQSQKNWTFERKINLPENTRPLGMVFSEGSLWISDPDNDQVFRVDDNGAVQETVANLGRPMHIDALAGKLYVPNFGLDSISIYEQGKPTALVVDSPLDAPAGVAIQNGKIAVADFYNHRVLIIENGKITQVGEEGRTDGKLFYPTDIKLYMDKIFVADAYNNRVQIFDLDGTFLKVIGWQEKIRVATGLDVSNDQIYVTDYYGDRVLVYNLDGILLNTLEGQFNKPTDVLVEDDRMYVANYGENTISVYARQ